MIDADQLADLQQENTQLRFALRTLIELLPGQVPTYIQDLLHDPLPKESHDRQ